MGADGRPVIVVDDEELVADTIALILRSNGYEAIALYDPKSAIAQLETIKSAIVISDIEMPGMNGVQLAVFVQERYPDSRVILISGQADGIESLDEARRNGHVFEILQKPIPPADLLTKIAS